MDYLTPEEYSTYATEFPIVDSHVAIASKLINSYCGRSFGSIETTDSVVLNKKMSGKLKQSPVVSVDKVYAVTRLPSGKSKVEVNIEDDFECSENGYFTYYGQENFHYPGYGMPTPGQIFKVQHSYLEVKYTYGYAELPEDIKTACGMIAQNIAQAKQFAGVKEISDFDSKVVFDGIGFISADIRLILNKYRKV